MTSQPSKIKTYLQDRPADWLKDHPHERWRCDIFVTDGSDHHGIGATEPEALMNASMAYLKWIKSPDRQVRQVRPDGSFPGMTFRSERASAADKVWTTPSSEDAYLDGKASGLFAGRCGEFYMAGGPWVPRVQTYNPDEAWNAYANQCALVNAEWLRGWKDGQVEAKQGSLEPQPQPDTDAQLQGHMFGDTRPQRSEVDPQVDFHYHRIGRD